RNIARWDGAQWSAVGGGIDALGYGGGVMTVFDDDGPGPDRPALYVGGAFRYAGRILANGIARWDGSAWSAVAGPEPNPANASKLVVVDPDGSGPLGARLYAVANASAAPGSQRVITEWNGHSWSTLTELSPVEVQTFAGWPADPVGHRDATLFIGGGFDGVAG